jgi:hypothetical protein
MADRLTNIEYCPEIEFCNHCNFRGEPNGCNRDGGACDEYSFFVDVYDRLVVYENIGLTPEEINRMYEKEARHADD